MGLWDTAGHLEEGSRPRDRADFRRQSRACAVEQGAARLGPSPPRSSFLLPAPLPLSSLRALLAVLTGPPLCWTLHVSEARKSPAHPQPGGNSRVRTRAQVGILPHAGGSKSSSL